jgi:hypothetical protein
MDSSTVYIKTARGSEEIASRNHGLSSRVRAMLIMVDGRRNRATLLAQSPAQAEAESHLAALLDGGFIAAVNPPPAASEVQIPASTPPAPAVDLDTVKHFINTTLHDTLGPDADLFAVKVDAVKNVPDLLALAEKLRGVIGGAGSRKKADDFWQKVSSMLG